LYYTVSFGTQSLFPDDYTEGASEHVLCEHADCARASKQSLRMSEPPGEQIDSHKPGNFQERESVDEGDDASMASGDKEDSDADDSSMEGDASKRVADAHISSRPARLRETLRAAISQSGLTQAKFATSLGINPSYMSTWLNNSWSASISPGQKRRIIEKLEPRIRAYLHGKDVEFGNLGKLPCRSCKHCGKIIINRGALHNHEQRCLEIQARQRAQDLQEEVRPRTSCKYCGKVIVNGGALHNHEQRCLEIQARQRAQDLQEESRLSAATASAPLPAQQSIIKKARQAALAAAAAEGLELLADASEPSRFAGVQVHRTLKGPRYSARVTLVSSSRQKYRTRVLSNSCTTPEEAALCVARGYRAIARGELLPF
jgi:DNA-binding transcriptional regulator YiaG